MATQSHFYPCNETSESMCTKCNSGLTSSVGTDGSNCSRKNTGSKGADNSIECSAYCNSNCNSKCESNQAYCYVNHEFIKDHEDVGAYPGELVAKNDFIHIKWSLSFWNNLIEKLNTAEIVGKNVPQGGEINVSATLGDPITAKFYNDIEAKIANFNSSYDTVSENQIITDSIANAIKTAYESATFNASVCDVCNASGSQSKQVCNCNCPTCSSCPSCSACPSCSCSCSCNCSGCNCTCGSNKPAS